MTGRNPMHRLVEQFTKFGLVGAVGLVIDLGLFNLLRLTVLAPELVHEGPVLAKLASTTVAIVANWIGNRLWTFREHRGRQLVREGVEFGIVSVGGMLIGLMCLWVSHYVLGFTSVLADNIASNVVGLALGTLFRFSLYRWWVFAPHRSDTAPPLFPSDEATADEASVPAESAVGPAGFPPAVRVEAIAPVDDVRPGRA